MSASSTPQGRASCDPYNTQPAGVTYSSSLLTFFCRGATLCPPQMAIAVGQTFLFDRDKQECPQDLDGLSYWLCVVGCPHPTTFIQQDLTP